MANRKKPVQAAKPKPITKKVAVVPNYQIETKASFWKDFKWAALIIVVLSVGLYLPSINYAFVLDDKIVYEENNYVKEGLSGIKKIFSTESFQGYFGEQKDFVVGARYRPLSIATFAVEHEFFGLNPKVGHIGNVVFYGLACLLLFRVLGMMFPLKEGQKWYWSIPFVASLLYVTHPLHVEVVANIKGRDEIMTMMGALGSLYFSFKYIQKEQLVWLVLASLSYLLGLFSKENAITFLAVIPASIYFFTKASFRQHLKVIVPLLLITAIYLYIRYSVIGYFLSSGKEVTSLMNNPFVEMNGSQKLATIIYTLGLYFKLLFFPHPLTHDYYPYHIPIMNWLKPGTLISFLLYAGLGLYALKSLFRKELPSYLIIFYLATLSVVSNLFFPVGTFMNERFLFISSIAACIFMAWMLIDKIPQWSKLTLGNTSIPTIAIGLFLPFLLGFTFKTITRLPAWENGYELNAAAIKVSTNSARANVFMGTAIFNKYQESTDTEEKKRLLDEAEPYIDKALEIHPPYVDALTMKAGIAAERFRSDNQLQPMLDALMMVGRHRPNHTFFNQYLDYLGKTRAKDPELGRFYYDLAVKYWSREKENQDIALFLLNKALNSMPENARVLMGASEVVGKRGDMQQAQNYASKAYYIDPSVFEDQ
jgi:tetratricopeptide (TPR) repeat protein